jgi:hypothetical protein
LPPPPDRRRQHQTSPLSATSTSLLSPQVLHYCCFRLLRPLPPDLANLDLPIGVAGGFANG